MTTLLETRTARKPYACRTCGGTIATGEVHVRETAKVAGKYVSARSHAVCPIPPPPDVPRRTKPTRVHRIDIVLIVLGLLMLAALMVAVWGK